MGGGGGGGGGGEYVVGYGGGGVEYVDPNLVIQKARGIESSAKLQLQSLEWTSDVPNVTIDEILQDFLSLENGGGVCVSVFVCLCVCGGGGVHMSTSCTCG
jgi:hypothetical protein